MSAHKNQLPGYPKSGGRERSIKRESLCKQWPGKTPGQIDFSKSKFYLNISKWLNCAICNAYLRWTTDIPGLGYHKHNLGHLANK